MPKEYVGMVCNIELMSIFSPIVERNLSFQLEILLQTLSSKDWKVLALFEPNIAGNPRYFSKDHVALTLAIWRMLDLTF